MADIRTTGVLDDFDRPDENPLAGPTGVEWSEAVNTVWDGPMKLKGNSATGQFGGDSMSYWNQQSFSGDCECWAISGQSHEITEAWWMCMFQSFGNNASNGYAVRMISGGQWDLKKYLNDDFSTILDITSHALPDSGAHPNAVLMRRIGNDIEVWFGDYLSGYTTWDLVLSATDTTFTTGMYFCLGSSSDDGNNPSWLSFGGGIEFYVPQFYRRPYD